MAHRLFYIRVGFFFCDLDQILETISNLTTSVSNNFDNLQFFWGERVAFPKSACEKFQLVKWQPPLNTQRYKI